MNWLLTLVCCAGIFLCSGCRKPAPVEAEEEVAEAPQPSPTPIKFISVGVFLPLKGEGAQAGEAALNGLILAAEETNAKGGVLGQFVRLIVRDTKSEADKAEKAVRDLVDEDKVVAIIGGISHGTFEGSDVANEIGIPMMALASIMPGIPQKEPWIFRPCDVDAYSGRVMAKFAESIGATRAIVLYDSDVEYSRTLALDFGKQFKRKRSFQIAGEPYTSSVVNFSNQLNMIKKKNPEVVYLPEFAPKAAEIIKQARALGLTMPFLGTASWDSFEFLHRAGVASNDCYVPGRFNRGGGLQASAAFAATYNQKYNQSPSAMSALGYDAFGLVVNGIQAAESTEPAKLRKALRGIKKYEGITGLITLNPESAEPRPVPVLRVESGEFNFLETIAP